jgi:hypothetical protein
MLLAMAAHARQGEEAELTSQVEHPLTKAYTFSGFGIWNIDQGVAERSQVGTSLLATLPIGLGKRSNLFLRVGTTLISQPVEGGERVEGLGDSTLAALFAPRSTRRWIWGVGAIATAPTASDPFLGQEKWNVGPAGAVVYNNRKVTASLIAFHSWSVLGARGRRDVSLSVLQPGMTWALGEGWYLASAPQISADSEADSSERWLVPIGGGVGRVRRWGKRGALNAASHVYYNAVRPDTAARWQVFVAVRYLLAKKGPAPSPATSG